ncbi:hypothetical protein V5799_003211 [Amblyomma americanum]|uniref:Uncharacterized protein n=1 Tax=Amblyomma americanum TaxID=6943 RepID=A0AAQ4D9L5_AMBAM
MTKRRYISCYIRNKEKTNVALCKSFQRRQISRTADSYDRGSRERFGLAAELVMINICAPLAEGAEGARASTLLFMAADMAAETGMRA